MRLKLILSLTAIWILGSQLTLSAQSRSLKQCRDELQRKQQADFEAVAKASTRKTKSTPTPKASTKTGELADQTWAACVKGQAMPNFKVTTLSGEAIGAAQLKGKVTLINFWFMGCSPCLLEMPALNRLVEEYKDQAVTFIGFSTDKRAQLTPGFFAKHPFSFKIVPDAKVLADSFGFIGYPTTFVIDQEGKIADVFQGGPVDDSDQLAPYLKAKSAIDSLLATQK